MTTLSAGESAERVGRRVYALRTARGMTQRQLAEPRYPAAYVSSVEAGRRVPSTDALAHFAERLEVSTQELTTGRPADRRVRGRQRDRRRRIQAAYRLQHHQLRGGQGVDAFDRRDDAVNRPRQGVELGANGLEFALFTGHARHPTI